MRRIYDIERDSTGLPVRMVWRGDYEDPPKPRCLIGFKTLGGEFYSCKLQAGHRCKHEFQKS